MATKAFKPQVFLPTFHGNAANPNRVSATHNNVRLARAVHPSNQTVDEWMNV